jgi:hypothetical protein
MGRPPIGSRAMTAAERQRRHRAQLCDGRRVTKPVAPPRSWQIIAIAKDGRRYANGVRLGTEEEADLYRIFYVASEFWHADRIVIVGTLAIPTNDPSNVYLERTKRRARLLFPEGQCGLLGWHRMRARSPHLDLSQVAMSGEPFQQNSAVDEGVD